MTEQEIHELTERSKLDNAIIAGSEIRDAIQSLKRQRDVLGQEIGEIGTLLRINDPTIPLTGPELLVLCGDIKSAIRYHQQQDSGP